MDPQQSQNAFIAFYLSSNLGSRLIDRDELHLLNFSHTHKLFGDFFFEQATVRVVKIARKRLYEALANMHLVKIDN